MLILSLLLLWSVIALVLEAAVDVSAVTHKGKHVLYVIGTLPTIWISWSRKVVSKLTPFSVAARVQEFFLKR